MIGKAARQRRQRQHDIQVYMRAFDKGWEPPHYASHAYPCMACKASWVTLPDGSGIMDHALDCTLMVAMDRAAMA